MLILNDIQEVQYYFALLVLQNLNYLSIKNVIQK